ncbi:MAG: RNA-binding S4 domain-containing protein [Lachnospiraceae bacterium]|nr:RNA-binding S4 domain-containing protein [Lachnospiraceae bacterium]
MEKVKIRDGYIKLGQALKLAGLVESGVDAKIVIQDGQVKVNGHVETQRGKKLVVNDEVNFEGNTFVIVRDKE